MYGGIRVVVLARIGAAKLKLQVDIDFGDAVTPEPVRILYPSLLDFPAPELPSYRAPRATARRACPGALARLWPATRFEAAAQAMQPLI
ncbi:MAG: nucleotidyl transferase AbiEii/AbiGii toxin family protein [Polyangiales bacterium]